MKSLFKPSLIAWMMTTASIPGAATVLFPQPVVQVVPGQTGILVFANLTNTDPVNTEYFNADEINLAGPFIVTDEFFTNVPLSLGPGQSSGPIELFQVDVPDGTPIGLYTGTYDLQGGVGTNNQSNFDVIESQVFSINVIPEPSTLLLLGSSLTALYLRKRRRKAPKSAGRS